ncbi:hypothetical protein FACS1894151_10400 [Spirochaetia bacterium]|nr:hypothetical protein FACS1894151_10400 [Spirochaetia bacterium]
MASEKNPSIFSDRSTIGSSKELDEYGVWVKSDPQDISSAPAENSPSSETLPEDDLLDTGEDAIIENSAGEEDAVDDEALNGEPLEGLSEDDFEFDESSDDSLFDFDAGAELPESEASSPDGDVSEENSEAEENGFTEVSMEDFLEDLPVKSDLPAKSDLPVKSDASEEDPPANKPKTEPEKEGTMNQLEYPETENSGNSSATGTAHVLEQANQLLLKIAEELSAIKGELSGIKKNMALGGAHAELSEEEENKAAASGGFFDDDTDEKIALTGDELDNILNTADFTEETGSDATENLDDDFTLGTESEEQTNEETFFTESDFDLGEADMDELAGEFSDNEAITADNTEDIVPVVDSPELKQIMEEGVIPVTEAPDDTSYLEADILADTSIDESDLDEISLDEDFGLDEDPSLDEDLGLDEVSLDLSGAVIDEPDLSAELKENPIEEPSLDSISVDLDLDEDLSIDTNALDTDILPENELAFDVDLGDDDLSLDDEDLEIPVTESDTDELTIPGEEDDSGEAGITEESTQVESASDSAPSSGYIQIIESSLMDFNAIS